MFSLFRNINTEIAPYLILELGCDPEATNSEDASPMKYFYQYGELRMIKHCIKLRKHDPRTWKFHFRPFTSLKLNSINEQQDSLHRTQSSLFVVSSPLDLACSKDGSLDVVKFLVEEYGLDPLERVKIIGSDDTQGVLQLLDLKFSATIT